MSTGLANAWDQYQQLQEKFFVGHETLIGKQWALILKDAFYSGAAAMKLNIKDKETDLLQLLANGATHNGLTLWAAKHGITLQAGGDLQDRVKLAARAVSK